MVALWGLEGGEGLAPQSSPLQLQELLGYKHIGGFHLICVPAWAEMILQVFKASV